MVNYPSLRSTVICKASGKGLSESSIFFRESREICITIWCMIDWGLPVKMMTLSANQGKRQLKEKPSSNYTPLRVGLVICLIFPVPYTRQSPGFVISDSFATAYGIWTDFYVWKRPRSRCMLHAQLPWGAKSKPMFKEGLYCIEVRAKRIYLAF